ncbi:MULTISPECIES: phosphonate C-P lyase system protein PhnG [Pacificibacter]|uniref:phosphonate C-P lyase system protein PhnG n=1 Tax=Pacificibacter TaxID=1042323 RepID=UPI001C08AF56|nr:MULTISPECIES: phosphonate C-P lyase system protein PhnG [Pacificibacter]MBU2937737.1 phosphonate C-P lyase system protein PhnG [Pacificibacter marinus]MDO6616231.1 phosphonate C-P lyase system protein PhnG [Pacificibacter sp. 1_MG-2023]
MHTPSQEFSHDDALSILARADAAALKALGEDLAIDFSDVEVVHSRTGLVMLPLRDTAKGTAFHLGEVLVSEAHIRRGIHEGYGLRKGLDLEASMAMALVDIALASGTKVEICHDFLRDADAQHRDADTETLRRIEATRVDMETF